MPAIDANCFCATGNISPRTICVSRTMATPKLPVMRNRLSSTQKIGFSMISNQPQSIARSKPAMPCLSW